MKNSRYVFRERSRLIVRGDWGQSFFDIFQRSKQLLFELLSCRSCCLVASKNADGVLIEDSVCRPRSLSENWIETFHLRSGLSASESGT